MNALPPLDQLYSSHGAAVLRRARALLGDESDAQEILHDVFASLLHKPEQFGGQSSVMTFLYRMTTNLSLQHLRNHQRRLELLKQSHDPEGERLGQAQEAHAELRELLGSLPEDLGQVAIYYYLDEMSQEEICKILDCSRQWVGKLLGRLGTHLELSR